METSLYWFYTMDEQPTVQYANSSVFLMILLLIFCLFASMYFIDINCADYLSYGNVNR